MPTVFNLVPSSPCVPHLLFSCNKSPLSLALHRGLQLGRAMAQAGVELSRGSEEKAVDAAAVYGKRSFKVRTWCPS